MLKLVTPVHQRDLENVKKNSGKWFNNLPIEEAVIISNGVSEDSIDNANNKIDYINENEVLTGLTYRCVDRYLKEKHPNAVSTGWYFQQFLKMAYALICDDEYYLIWDADLIPLRKIYLFNDEEKPFLTIKREFHEPYFRTINNLFKGRVVRNKEGSCIAEHMLIKASIMREMIMDIQNNSNEHKDFWKVIIDSIDNRDINNSGFSEYETYGNYCICVYPQQYQLRRLKTCRHGMLFFGKNPSDAEINWASESYDTLAIETKGVRSFWGKVLCLPIIRNRYTFRECVHWYKKRIMKVDQGYMRLKGNINILFWKYAKAITVKLKLYDFLCKFKG